MFQSFIRKGKHVVPVALASAIVAIHLWSLLRFPVPSVDEAWLASRAWAFVRTGRPFGPLDAGVFDRFEGHWTIYAWLATWLQSLPLRLLPSPALPPLRILSLLFGLLLLAAVYAIARHLHGRRVGLLSVFLVSMSLPFFHSAHLARRDIMAAALGFVAIALYFYSRSSRPWVGLLSGLCVGLALEIHPYSILYAPTILVLYFWDSRWSMLRKGHFWGFAAGIGLGAAAYVVLHVLPFPESYLGISQIGFASVRLPAILTLDPRMIVEDIGDMGFLAVRMFHFLVPVIACAVVALMRRGSEADKTLLVLNAALVGGVILLIRGKSYYYAILFAPAIGLMLGAYLFKLSQQLWLGRLRDYVTRFFVWGLCIGSIVLNLFLLKTDMWPAYRDVQDHINQVVQPGESIMASQTYWFGLYDHVYYSWEQLVYYQRYAPGSTLEDALREFHPDILIIDRHMDTYITDDVTDSAFGRHLRVPRTELETFLNRQADLIAVAGGSDFGAVRVYRLAWEEEE